MNVTQETLPMPQPTSPENPDVSSVGTDGSDALFH